MNDIDINDRIASMQLKNNLEKRRAKKTKTKTKVNIRSSI